MNNELIRDYFWLVNLLISNQQGLTLVDILSRYSNEHDGKKLPRTTFVRWKNNIEEIFNIEIQCSGKYRYFVKYADLSEAQRWNVNSFSIGNAVNEASRLKGRFQLEDIPSGQTWLVPITIAMKNNQTITFQYSSMLHPEPHDTMIDPYFVKLFKQRWYVVGYSHSHDRVSTFSLERISELVLTKHKFELPRDFDYMSYFDECYGIIRTEEPKLIKLKFNSVQSRYISELPLHTSQKLVSVDNDGSSIYSFYLRPTYDFLQTILSYGSSVEVLEPTELRASVAGEIIKMMSKYKCNEH